MNKNKELLPYYLKLSKLIRWEDGKPYWIKGNGANVTEGSLAGYLKKEGYRIINIKVGFSSKLIYASRLRWFMEHEEIPLNCVDHINRERDDNRIQNIRLATQAQNNRNMSKRKGTTSIYKGVSWSKQVNKWRAGTSLNGKSIYIGTFECEKKAGLAYNDFAIEHFGEFASVNLIEEELNYQTEAGNERM